MTKFWSAIGWLCILAAGAMYQVGGTNSHLTELREFFWAPIPVALIAFFLSAQPRR